MDSCLLSDAASTDPDDAAAWSVVMARARALTVDLRADRLIPSSLVVAPADPPVVVQRTLARVWRHLVADGGRVDRRTRLGSDVPEVRASISTAPGRR